MKNDLGSYIKLAINAIIIVIPMIVAFYRKKKRKKELQNYYESMERKNYERALWHIDKYLEKKTNDGIAYFYKATLLTELGRFEDAVSYFEKAIKIDESIFDAQKVLGNHYKNEGRFEEAVWRYNAALQIKRDKDVYYNSSIASLAAGYYKDAEKSLKNLLKEEDGNKDYIYSALLNIYKKLDDKKNRKKYEELLLRSS